MHTGTLTLDRDTTFKGMVIGDLIVAPGVRAAVKGMVKGDVIVGDKADVIVSGMVTGTIRNHGGHVAVTGMVTG